VNGNQLGEPSQESLISPSASTANTASITGTSAELRYSKSCAECLTAKPVFQDFPLHRLFSRLPWHSETARKQQASPVASINHQDQLTFSNHSDRSVQPAEERKSGIGGKRAPG
jgi:hypothetical protein